MMDVIEFAEIRTPVLTAGTHTSHNAGAITLSEEELDQYIRDSNAHQDLIRQSIELQKYPGDPGLSGRLKKPIPGVLNIKHQDPKIFPETIKDRVKDVAVEFHKEAIDGKNWVVERFKNVPKDIAKGLKEHYPYRSVELIEVKDPERERPLKLIRSTAFLNTDTPPAVKGQSPQLAVEFAEGDSPVIVLMCDENIDTSSRTNTQEAAMPKNVEEKEGKQPEVKEVDVSELTGKLSEKEAEIAELQAALEATKEKEQSTVAELQAEQERAQAHILELQEQQDQAEVREFCLKMENTTLVDKAGQKYIPSPAYNELVKLNITASPKSAVIEFADGVTKTTRESVQEIFSQVLELAKTNSILVPVSEMAQSFEEPNAKKESDLERAKALQKAEDITFNAALLRVKEGK